MTERQEKFTPGPWHVTTNLDYWVEHSQPRTDADRKWWRGDDLEASGEPFTGVAHCGDISWPNHEKRQAEWQANAHLIAAAPELYEALSSLMDRLNGAFIRDAKPGGSMDTAWNDAVVALHKARGKQ